MPAKRPTTTETVSIPRAGRREKEFAGLQQDLARQLAQSDLSNQFIGIAGQAGGDLMSRLQGGFLSLSPEQNQYLSSIAGQELGGLLGNLTSRGIQSSSIAGGAAAGLATGLVGLRANLAQQNFMNSLQAIESSLSNRARIQAAVESPLNRLTQIRLAQTTSTKQGPSSSPLAEVLGGLIGQAPQLAIAALTGTPPIPKSGSGSDSGNSGPVDF